VLTGTAFLFFSVIKVCALFCFDGYQSYPSIYWLRELMFVTTPYAHPVLIAWEQHLGIFSTKKSSSLPVEKLINVQ